MSDLRNTVLVTISLLIGAFFSYLLQFFLGRELSVGDYGTFNTLLSLASVVGVPATVLSTALIKEVASLHAKNEVKKISALFWQTLIWSTAAGVVIFGFFYLFQDSIFGYLKLSEQWLIVSFITYLSLTFLAAMPYSYFQGLLQYKTYALVWIVNSVLRFMLPAFVLFYNKSLPVLFISLTLALLLSFLFCLLFLRRNIVKVSDLSAWKEMLAILKYSLPLMAINLCLLSYNNNDLILVRSHFDAQTAGYYAGVITLGKILLFGTLPVATVMYPKIVAVKAKGQNIYNVLKKFFAMQMAVVSAGVMIFILVPKFIALAFFGTKFLESVNYLPYYSLFIALYVILNFLIMFLFAVDVTQIYSVLIFLAFAQIILISKIHASLMQVIWINFGILLAGVLYTGFTALNYLRKTRDIASHAPLS